MILKVKWNGPYAVVTVPQLPGQLIKVGDVVSLRVADGVPISRFWTIVEGQEEYEAGLEAAKASRAAAEEAKSTRAADTVAAVDSVLALTRAGDPAVDGGDTNLPEQEGD